MATVLLYCVPNFVPEVRWWTSVGQADSSAVRESAWSLAVRQQTRRFLKQSTWTKLASPYQEIWTIQLSWTFKASSKRNKYEQMLTLWCSILFRALWSKSGLLSSWSPACTEDKIDKPRRKTTFEPTKNNKMGGIWWDHHQFFASITVALVLFSASHSWHWHTFFPCDVCNKRYRKQTLEVDDNGLKIRPADLCLSEYREEKFWRSVTSISLQSRQRNKLEHHHAMTKDPLCHHLP